MKISLQTFYTACVLMEGDTCLGLLVEKCVGKHFRCSKLRDGNIELAQLTLGITQGNQRPCRLVYPNTLLHFCLFALHVRIGLGGRQITGQLYVYPDRVAAEVVSLDQT